MPLRRLRLNQAVWIGGGVVIVFMTVFQVYDVLRRIEIVEESARRELLSTVRLLSEHTSAALRAVDLAMHDAQREFKPGATDDHLRAALREQVARLPQLLDIGIVPAADRAAPPGYPYLPPIDVRADGASHPPSAQMRLSAAYFVPERNAWSVALLRDVDIPGSAFRGVVMASLDLDYFKTVYDRLGPPAGSHTELLTRDGRVLVGHPNVPAAAERAAIESAYQRLLAAGDQSVRLLQQAHAGAEQFYVAQAVAGFPVAVGMRVDRAMLLSPWYVQAGHSTARTASLCISVAALMWLVLRQLRRREQTEARLREAEKHEALGTMASGIAHDFNSVLAAIHGHGNLAQARIDDPTLTRHHLARMLSAVERGRGLAEQILTYSRGTRGTRMPVDVAAIARDTLDLIRAGLPPQMELRFRQLSTATTVLADPTHVHQLLMNLCDNAMQAMDRGGALEIDVDAVTIDTPTGVSHGTLRAGRHVLLRVRDHGEGIRGELLDRLFEPFFTTRHARGGTGLGLALVHAIVTDLGGAIDVNSSAADGTTFTLYLPASATQADSAASAEDALPRGQGQRIMVVDDEQELMLLHEEMLAALNYEPVGFVRPNEALAEFAADPLRVDALVLDHRMHDMAGIELARRMHAIRGTLPIVLVTGQPAAIADSEASAAGILRILSKPLDFRELAHALSAALHAP